MNMLPVDALSFSDPEESVRLRLAEKYLSEAEEYVSRGDAIRASEMAYKAAEELVKALAERLRTREYQQAQREGRWYTYMLFKAAVTISTSLGRWVLDGWNSAYSLHVWGFHENKLDVEEVKTAMEKIKQMLEETKRVLP
ncbi:MAG: PaREP1 family protein [Pyrobaculum sp.]